MPKAAAKPAVDPKVALLAGIVDEIGAIEAELAPWKPKIARVEQLRKALRSHYDESPAADSFGIEGKRYVAAVGERGMQSVVDNAKLFTAIGIKPFISLASFTVKALTDSVEPAVRLAVVTQEQTGPRGVTVVEKGSE